MQVYLQSYSSSEVFMMFTLGFVHFYTKPFFKYKNVIAALFNCQYLLRYVKVFI